MSSTTGLSRTRSLRQPPATSRNQLTQRDGANNASESGSASPSRLPQIKPLTRSGTISGTTSSSSTTSSAATARSRAASSAKNTTTTASGRPLSGIFSSKPSTTSTTTSSTTTATRQRAPTGPENATAARPLGRAPSIRQVSSQQQPTATTTSTTGRRVPSSSGSSITTAKRPTSSGGLPSSSASKTRAPTHTRAKSTATALTAATTLRPPISSTSSTTNSSVGGRGSPSSASTTSTVSHASRPSTTRLHARNASQSAAAAAVPQSPVASSRGQRQHRPAFDTNQQHYSPLKAHAPKPLTSTFLAPPSPSKLPSNVAISAETSRLQTELLQLSLLHREAGAVTRQWHESARRKLGRRFKEAAAQHESVCARERDGVEARNVAALLRWGSSSQEGGRLGLEEKLQALDQILDGVWALSDPEGGRYGRVVEGFEAWAGRMANIMAKRRSGRADDLVRGDEPVLFVSDLDVRWKDECPGLVRKLEAWCLMLNEIGPAPDNNESSSSSSSDKEHGGRPQQRSSLSQILEGCTSLVVDMLAELEVMLDIERDARRSEDDWIERMSEQLKIGDHETMDREPPLWKMVI